MSETDQPSQPENQELPWWAKRKKKILVIPFHDVLCTLEKLGLRYADGSPLPADFRVARYSYEANGSNDLLLNIYSETFPWVDSGDEYPRVAGQFGVEMRKS